MPVDRNPRPPRHDRASVLDAAMHILDEHGLADLTMRRLGAALDVQPSALYWHFENKQTLLAALADRIVDGARVPARSSDWRDEALQRALALRDALLAYRDGAEVVLSTSALGLGSDAAREGLRAPLGRGVDSDVAELAATVLLQYTLGHASLVQQRLQADSLGAVADHVADAALAIETSFEAGVRMLLAGIPATAVSTRSAVTGSA